MSIIDVMNSYINAIGTATPKYKIRQEEVLEFMIKAHGLNEEEAHRLTLLYKATGIKERNSVLPDYQKGADYEFYHNTLDLEPFPSTKQRQSVFKKEAIELSLQAVKSCTGDEELKKVTHLITVSCTGLYAPGLDIELVLRLGLATTIQRTAINFMGCYAAFNAIKMGDNIIRADKNAKVLIVCTELCSIHFQKENNEDNLLANALFADGSAALIMSSEPSSGLSLTPKSFNCELMPNGMQDMAWGVGDFGFEMKLSAYVPDIIQEGIGQLLTKGKVASETDQIDYYAIHPGGKRILQVIEKELGLTREDNRYAYDILANNGNMSSCTVLFVLKALLCNLDASDKNKKIMSFAFGPGLTLESMILNINHA